MTLRPLFPVTQQFQNKNGSNLVGGKVYVYFQGRTALATTYHDEDGTVVNANPVLLDNNGRATVFADTIYSYTIVVCDYYGKELFSQDITLHDAISTAEDVLVIGSNGSVKVDTSTLPNGAQYDLSVNTDIIATKKSVDDVKTDLTNLTGKVDNHTTQIGQIQESVAGIETTVSNKKDKQTELAFNGSATKTVKSITQNANGELNVVFENIDLPQEVPNVEITSEDKSIKVSETTDVQTNTKKFDLSVQGGGTTYSAGDAIDLTNNTISAKYGKGLEITTDNKLQLKVGKGLTLDNDTLELTIKDLATSITDFRDGDVILVDGPSGTAKMSKDDLLKETAENALAGNVALAFDATKDYVGGDVVEYGGNIYRFNVAHNAGSWIGTDAELVDVFEAIKNVENDTLYGNSVVNAYAVSSGVNLNKYIYMPIRKGILVSLVADCVDSSWNKTSCLVKTLNYDGTATEIGWTSGGKLEFIPTQDCKGIFVHIVGSTISASGTITITIKTSSILDELDTSTKTLSSIEDGYYNLPVVKADAKHFRIVNGIWTANNKYDTFIFPASEFVGGTAVIVGNGVVSTNVAFLTSDSIVDGTSVSFVSGTGLTSYSNDKTLCLELPSGTNYVCVFIYRNNESEPYFKIKSGFVLDFFAPAKNQNDVGRKLNILEINLGGWAQGSGFSTPTEQALDDLRQLCADCDVDILVPSESGNEVIYRHFLNACFTQYWGRPADFSVYGVVPALRIPYSTKYKDVYMRSVPGQVNLGSDRGSRCLELEYNGFKGILVPAHWFPDESSPTTILDARFNEWLNDIGYTDYDFCIIVGDTNVMWGSSTITQDHPNFTHIVDYFTAKHFFWVNGGKSNTIVAKYRDTPFSLTDYFIKQTYFGANSNQNYNIDQMLIWSKNNDLCVSVAYKVFTQSEMSTKYPNLYAAMGSSDHVPTIFKVNLN